MLAKIIYKYMPEFYTVSRADISNLKELNLFKEEDILTEIFEIENVFTQNDAKSYIDKLYPNGISNHGKQYLYDKYNFVYDNQNKSYVSYINIIETTFELVRLWKFKNCPSRFTSIFACSTIEDAKEFRKNKCQDIGDIYKVSAKKYFKADMNLLLTGTTIGNFIFAEKYWNGESSGNPFWEYLLYDSVSIIQKIEE